MAKICSWHGKNLRLSSGNRLTYCTVWGGRLRKRFCNMFSESSTGSWAELQLAGCPSKQGELPENMLQNLLLNLLPQTVCNTGENKHSFDAYPNICMQ